MGSKDTQFKKGNKAGNGRPKGARNKLAKAYLKDLHEIYLDGGKEALKQVMKERPDGFLSLVARLLPKDLDFKQTSDIQVSIVRFADEQDDDEET